MCHGYFFGECFFSAKTRICNSFPMYVLTIEEILGCEFTQLLLL